MPLRTGLCEAVAEDRRRRGLLLASVSQSVASKASQAPPLALPSALLPQQLKKAISRLPKPQKQPGGGSGSAPGPDLRRAGAEIQRAAAVFAGVLIAGVAQVARQVAAARHGGAGGRQGGLQESFRLPWQFERRGGAHG